LRPPTAAITFAVGECKRLGLFTDFTENELTELLTQSYPFEPVTLYLLPRLSARVAQNERTLFNFLHTSDFTHPIDLESLYDFFAPAMRADTAVGGTYRQWLETQSALTKVGDDDTATKVLKAACLLGLGTSGERSRVSHALLHFAVRGYHGVNQAETVVEQLVE